METSNRRVYINYFDLQRLKMLLRTQGNLNQPDKAPLHALATDLDRAVVVSDKKFIPKVVTMNSRFRLKDLDDNKEDEFTLVFPGKSSKGLGKLSVLTPMGAAVLGVEEGQTVSLPTQEGTKRFRIESISTN